MKFPRHARGMLPAARLALDLSLAACAAVMVIGNASALTLRVFAVVVVARLLFALLEHRQESHDSVVAQATGTGERDALTGLLGRAAFEREAQRLQSRVTPGGIGVVLLDLDLFAQVNSSLGHQAGDQLLREAARRLAQQLPQGVVLGRLSGDEFAIAAAAPLDVAVLAAVAVEQLARPYEIAGRCLHVTASAGCSAAADASPVEHLRRAGVALQEAKAAGRNDIVTYRKTARPTGHRLLLASDLRGSVDGHDLEMLYQPQVDVHGGQLVGFEALMRWRHPDRGQVGPGEFIPVAEASGLIVPLGTWALRESVRQAALWLRSGHPMRVAVNVSAIQLARPDFTALVREALSEHELPPHLLQLELTETALVKDLRAAGHQLSQLALMGVKIAIDDFGTGHANLMYLRHLKVHAVKLDRSFVLALDEGGGSLIEGIVGLAHRLGLTVTAEGVERADQAHVLRELRCDHLQGHLIARPLSAADAAQFVARHAAVTRDVAVN